MEKECPTRQKTETAAFTWNQGRCKDKQKRICEMLSAEYNLTERLWTTKNALVVSDFND